MLVCRNITVNLYQLDLFDYSVCRMWKMLDSKMSRTSKICVLMLFHAVALGDGNKYFWAIVNGDCTHKNWQIR